MSLFVHRWVFARGKTRSREYRTVSGCVRAGMRQLPRLAIFEIVYPGNDSLTERGYSKTAARLRTLLRRKKTGIRYSVIAIHPKDQHTIVGRVHFRVTRSMPKPADVPGTPLTQRWAGIVKQFWPFARFAGTVACKPDSDHALGAALDFFDTWERMEEAHKLAITEAEIIGTKYSILGDDIWTAGPPWTNSTRGHHTYTGTYHYHHHLSLRDGKHGIFCTAPPGYGR